MRFSRPKGNLHDLDVCGLEIDGRQLCPACERAALAEARHYETALRRCRRIKKVRRALPPVLRAWLRALIRRAIAQLRTELTELISQQLADELPEAVHYALATREGLHNGTQARHR
jgi:hypothetical protein